MSGSHRFSKKLYHEELSYSTAYLEDCAELHRHDNAHLTFSNWEVTKLQLLQLWDSLSADIPWHHQYEPTPSEI